MPIEQEVSKAYSLILPGKILDGKVDSKNKPLVEGFVQLGGQFHAGREEFAHEAIGQTLDNINPALRSFVGDEGLKLEDTQTIILPSQGSGYSGRKSGDVSQFEKGLQGAEEGTLSPKQRTQNLDSELKKIEEQLRNDLASQKMLISGTRKTIEGLREEMSGVGYSFSSGVSSTLNVGYSSFHHLSKWAGWGVLEEEPISLNQQNERTIQLWQNEIEFRQGKVKEIEKKLSSIEEQKLALSKVSTVANESEHKQIIERVLTDTKQILLESREPSQEVKNLEFKWKAQKELVDKGFSNLDNQLAIQEAVLGGAEKGLVIGLAIGGGVLIGMATGGVALPWYTSAVYGFLLAMGVSTIQFGVHVGSGNDISKEADDFKSDFKDSILYSLSGVFNKLWVGARTLATGKILGVTAETGAAKAGATYFASWMRGIGGWISGAGSGVRHELIPAAYDSFIHDDIETLDPTGYFRNQVGRNDVEGVDMQKWTGIDNFRIRIKNFSERIGSAGIAGAVSHGMGDLRGNWGLDKCFKTSGASGIGQICQGLRGSVVEVASEGVETTVGVLNTLYIEATWAPYVHGLESTPKDKRELQQIVASSIGGSISGRLNNSLRNQAEAGGKQKLTDAQNKFKATGVHLEDNLGVKSPDIALSASQHPLVIEGNKKTTVAANLGEQYGLIENSATKQEHRMAGKQAAMMDASKGGVTAEVVKHGKDTLNAVKNDLGIDADKSLVGQRRVQAVDAVTRSVERRSQSLANAEIDDNYVTRVLNERKLQPGSKPSGWGARILGFLDQAANPYGKITGVDSIVDSEETAKAGVRENRRAYRAAVLDTVYASVGPFKLSGRGIYIETKTPAKDSKVPGRDSKIKVLHLKDSQLHVLNIRVFDGQKIADFGTKVWDGVASLGSWGPIKHTADFTIDAAVKPVAGIAVGTLLLPTTTIWMGPGVGVIGSFDVFRKGLQLSHIGNIFSAANQRLNPVKGFGNSIATGEMLARKVELEYVRDEYIKNVGPSPDAAQRRNLSALNVEINKAEKLFNSANKVGIVSRALSNWASEGLWKTLTLQAENKWQEKSRLLGGDTRQLIEGHIRDTYESALRKKHVARDTIPAVGRNLQAGLNDSSIYSGRNAQANRDRFMAEVDFVLGSESPLTNASKATLQSSLLAEISARKILHPGDLRTLNQMEADILGGNTAQFKDHRDKNISLKSIQHRQYGLERNQNIQNIIHNLEAGRIAPDLALRQLELLFDDPIRGKASMTSKTKGERSAYEQFKQNIETEIRLLSRRQVMPTGTHVISSSEYVKILADVGNGDRKATEAFKRIFDGAISSTGQADFIKNVILEPGTKSVGTPLEAHLRDWSTKDHGSKLTAIANVEVEVSRLNALPVGSPGALSATELAECNNILSNIRDYRNFTADIIANKPGDSELNRLIRSTNTHRTNPIDPRYQNILAFAETFGNPEKFLKDRLSRYSELVGKKDLSSAETIEFQGIESEFSALKKHIGNDIFKSVLGGIAHVQDRSKRHLAIRNENIFALSPVVVVDQLVSALSKAGDPKHSDKKAKRELITAFVAGLGGKVSKYNIDAIIESKGLKFTEFHKVVAELRNPATNASAKHRLETALAGLKLDKDHIAKTIDDLEKPVDRAMIADNASRMKVSEDEYKERVRSVYGGEDRPDLNSLLGSPSQSWWGYSAAKFNKFLEAHKKDTESHIDAEIAGTNRAYLVK